MLPERNPPSRLRCRLANPMEANGMPDTAHAPEKAIPHVPPGTTVIVTGGTGFIGGRLVERLAKDGAEVTCLIRGNDAGMRLHRAGAYIRKIDMTDAAAVDEALRGVDLVFHLAYDWGNTAWNFKALRSLIKGCHANGCKRLVHVSSFVVYDIPDQGELTEDTSDTPAGEGYAHTKLALETELLVAVRETGLPAAIVQPTIVYGPYSRPWTLDPADMLKFGTVVLPDAGEGICNAVYVDDVVSGMILAAMRPEAVGQRYLLSGPEPITWKEFYEGVARAIGAKGPRYQPVNGILRANAKHRKLLRMASDPRTVMRKVAGIGFVRKAVSKGLRVLPSRARSMARDTLYGPALRQRGRVHMPNPGHLQFLQGRSTIRSAKARQELGYTPVENFESGMKTTAQYLESIYRDAP